jgi:hypothetical protein
MFNVKQYFPDYYPELAGWWMQWGWDPVPEAFLPEGLVVSHDFKNICAVFIYKTSTPICWIENYISDKDAEKEIRDGALDLLIEAAIEKSREDGYKLAMSSIRHASLGRRLEKSGFVISDKNMTVYMRGL